jgi:hypothetical protein
MPQDDAVQCFDFQIGQAGFLVFGEIADLGLSELDVLKVALGHFRQRGFDFPLAQTKRFWRPIVEFGG